MSNALENLLSELAPTDSELEAQVAEEIATKVELMRVQVAKSQSQWGDLRIELEQLRSEFRRAAGEVDPRIESLETGAKTVSRQISNIADDVTAFTQLLDSTVNTLNVEVERIEVLDSKMSRVAEVLTAQDKTIKNLKARRFTVGNLIGIAIASALMLNSFSRVYTHQVAQIQAPTQRVMAR